MEKVKNADHFNWLIENNNLIIVYFSGDKCAVCSTLKPKIEMLVGQQYPQLPIIEIETEKFPEIAARYNVFSVPVIILFVEKREQVREARNVSISGFSQKIEKLVRLYSE
jgi:thioredoxin-like negative regulator of GroEL